MSKQMKFDEFAKRYCESQMQTPDGLMGILQSQIALWKPTGFLLLECQLLDSSCFGQCVIVPYGPKNTWKEIPKGPISPRGIASDMSIVIGVLDAALLV